MKHLSAVEVHYVVAELQVLMGARLDQVYQQARKELILQFHVRNKGRALLKVRVPDSVYIASTKDPASVPTGFCSLLRKKLKNSHLRSAIQPGFERIIELQFSSKSSHLSLYLELFSKGNVILVQAGKILAASEKQTWRSRTIATSQDYILPPSATDPTSLDDKQLQKLLLSTNKTDIVRFLALELSLGGLYAEEACSLSFVDKKRVPNSMTTTEISGLIKAIHTLLNSKLSPSVIYDNQMAVDAVPISLNNYKNLEKKPFKSFSEALEALSLTADIKKSPYDLQISRLQTILDQQQSTILESKNLAQKSSRSAELIYEHYQDVKQLLETVNTLRKSQGWQEVKQLRKSNKKLKSIDEKKGKIVVDL